MNIFANEWSPTSVGETMAPTAESTGDLTSPALETNTITENYANNAKDCLNIANIPEYVPSSELAMHLEATAFPYKADWEALPASTASEEIPEKKEKKLASSAITAPEFYPPQRPSTFTPNWADPSSVNIAPRSSVPPPLNRPTVGGGSFGRGSLPFASMLNDHVSDRNDVYSTVMKWDCDAVTWPSDGLPSCFSETIRMSNSNNALPEQNLRCKPFSFLLPPMNEDITAEISRDWDFEFRRVINLTGDLLYPSAKDGNQPSRKGGAVRSPSASCVENGAVMAETSKKGKRKNNGGGISHDRVPSISSDGVESSTQSHDPDCTPLFTWAEALHSNFPNKTVKVENTQRVLCTTAESNQGSSKKSSKKNKAEGAKEKKKGKGTTTNEGKGEKGGGKGKAASSTLATNVKDRNGNNGQKPSVVGNGEKNTLASSTVRVAPLMVSSCGHPNERGKLAYCVKEEEEDGVVDKEELEDFEKYKGGSHRVGDGDYRSVSNPHSKWEGTSSVGEDGRRLPPLTKNGNHRWRKLTKGQQRRELAQKNAFESFAIALLHTASPFTIPLRQRAKTSLPHIKVDQRFGKPGQPQSAIAQFVVAPLVTNYRPRHFHDITPGDLLEYHYDLSHVLQCLSTAYALLLGYGPTWKRFAVPYAYIACQDYRAEVLSLCPQEIPNTRGEPIYEEDVLKDITEVVLAVEELEPLQHYSFHAAMRKRLHLAPLYDVLETLFRLLENYQVEIWHMDQTPSTFILKTNRAEVESHRPIYLDGNAELWDQLPQVSREDLKNKCTVWQKARKSGNKNVKVETHNGYHGSGPAILPSSGSYGQTVGGGGSGDPLGFPSFPVSPDVKGGGEGQKKEFLGLGKDGVEKSKSGTASIFPLSSIGESGTRKGIEACLSGTGVGGLKGSANEASSSEAIHDWERGEGEDTNTKREFPSMWIALAPIAISVLCMTITVSAILRKKKFFFFRCKTFYF